MNVLTDLLPLFLCSVALQCAFLTWKRLSHTWGSWFPLFQKAARFALWASVAGTALALVFFFFTSEREPGLKALAVALGLSTFALFKRFVNTSPPEERTERGAVIATPQVVKRQVAAHMRKNNQKSDLAIGGVPVPTDAEPYHLLISGSTGSGKSVAIRGILDVLREREDTVILVDSGGEFMSLYWDGQRDVVLNPFDARCAPWSPLAEIDGPWDTGALARSIVPDGTGDMKEWNSYAQTFLMSCMQGLIGQGRTKLSDLLWAVQQASVKELQPLLAGTPAASQLGSEKSFGSIRTIAGNYMAPYNYLEDSEEAAFSVSEFVKHARGNFLYLTYRDDQLDSVRHMLSCVLDIAARAILSLKPDSNRRVWLIIDEFASIGKVQSIEAVATKARKVGGCLVIGLQSTAQLKDRYGEHQAQSILSCLSNSLTLRCSDGDTAELMSRNLGEAEVVRSSAGTSTSDSGIDSKSWNEQKTTQRLVLPSELQQLKNLEGYLKLSGSYPVCEVKLVLPKKRVGATEAFVARDFRAKPMLGQRGTAQVFAPAPTAPADAPTSAKLATPAAAAYRPNVSAGLGRAASAPVPTPAPAPLRAPAAPVPQPTTAPAVSQSRTEIVVTLRPRKQVAAPAPAPAPIAELPPSSAAVPVSASVPAAELGRAPEARPKQRPEPERVAVPQVPAPAPTQADAEPLRTVESRRQPHAERVTPAGSPFEQKPQVAKGGTDVSEKTGHPPVAVTPNRSNHEAGMPAGGRPARQVQATKSSSVVDATVPSVLSAVEDAAGLRQSESDEPSPPQSRRQRRGRAR